MTGNSLIAKALIYVKDTIPLRVVNFDNEKVNIYPGTHIANLSFVESLQPVVKKPCVKRYHALQRFQVICKTYMKEQLKA